LKSSDKTRVDLAGEVLSDAMELNASDIHLDPVPGAVRVRMRVDGRFIDRPSMEGQAAELLVGRLKIMAGLMVYRSDIPQEGRLQLSNGREARIAVIPTVSGEKASIRLFSGGGDREMVADLGLPKEHQQWLATALRKESGLVLVVGPSGSGKTTTLYAVMRDILAERGDFCQVCSIEDPVERHICGVTQVEVDRGRDLDFASGLKFLLRQDPEVVMVGEIRDAETARVAVRAAMTGHLVFSTLHCGRAAEARPRLLEMGVPEYAVNLGLVGSLALRLLRRFCESCGGKGCGLCVDTGFRGRCAVSEIVDRNSSEPAPTMAEVADRLVSERLLPASEVERVFGEGER
jgi:type II secretory ATPase GspE/PulE/Tfp pilus assembly ATPase PilB-like protein